MESWYSQEWRCWNVCNAFVGSIQCYLAMVEILECMQCFCEHYMSIISKTFRLLSLTPDWKKISTTEKMSWLLTVIFSHCQ